MTNSPTQHQSENPYCLKNVALFEAIYGKDLISLGGLAAIDNMFLGIDVKGLKALDIGFGLGGVTYYLANNYQMNVSGVDIHPWLVQYAKDHAPKNIADQLEFNTYTAKGELPYPVNTFDLAYSKGVLNHVADKHTLFKQINAVLKPGSLFIITDWIFPHATTKAKTPLICETKDSYQQVLTDAEFGDIEFRDDSKIFLKYVEELLKNLTKNQAFIKKHYDQEVFSTIWLQHEDLMQEIKQHHKFATRIVCKKQFKLSHPK